MECWYANCKEDQVTSSKLTTNESKKKAAIRAYGVAVATEELVTIKVAALRHHLDSDFELGRFCTVDATLFMLLLSDIFTFSRINIY